MLRCPHLDGTLDTLDDSEARKVAGVRDVIHIPGPEAGRAVHGAARRRRRRARRQHLGRDQGPRSAQGRPGSRVRGRRNRRARSRRRRTSCSTATKTASPCAAKATSRRRASRRATSVQARYEMPFLAHATMETPGALIDLKQDSALLIASLQSPGGASEMISALTGIPRHAIEIRMTRAGGGFGRRLENDFVGEAVLIAKAAGKPVKLIWTREDDLQHDFYRPFGVHALGATLDRKKKVTSWSHCCAATPRPYRENGRKRRIFDGCLEPDDFPAGLVANLDKTFFSVPSGMPRGWWRAPIHTFHAFSVQSFVDEIAVATKQDAVQLRLAMLGEPRQIPYSGHGGPMFDTGPARRTCCKRCADKIGWGVKRNDGHGIGIACHFTFGGYAAHAFEVSVAGTRAQDPSRGRRRRCRTRRQSARRRGADDGRHDRRDLDRAASRDHGQGRRSAAEEFPRLSAAAHGAGAADGRSRDRRIDAPTRPAPARSACRARRRRLRTRSTRRRRCACASCRSCRS